jgi:hypothetical protein
MTRGASIFVNPVLKLSLTLEAVRLGQGCHLVAFLHQPIYIYLILKTCADVD